MFKELNLIILLICWGCSSTQDDNFNENLNWTTHLAEPTWFKTTGPFALKNRNGDIMAHGFFDLDPLISKKGLALNFVVTTPEESKTHFELDILTGQKYLTHNYCKQKDVWEQYPETIYPNYTSGYVPRLFDGVGLPQKIIVFGRKEHYSTVQDTLSHRVRIVGSFILQYCQQLPCNKRFGWQTRRVMVAVDPLDTDFKTVRSIEELKKLVDWKYVYAFMQNGEGKNFTANRPQPAFRMVREFGADESMRLMINQGKIFKKEDLTKIRKSCERLYDYLWESSGQKILSDKQFNWGKSLREFNKKFGKRFATCGKYVYPVSINYDQNRHWFFAFINLFYKMNDLGFYYICHKYTWGQNPFNFDGKRTYDLSNSLRQCSQKSIGQAFKSAIAKLRTIRSLGVEFYRYIEYDNSPNGTHNKFYTWAKFKGKKLFCLDQDTKNIEKQNRDASIFPHDISWRKFILTRTK